MNRRNFLGLLAAASVLVISERAWAMGVFSGKKEMEEKIFPFHLSDAE